MTSGTFPCTLHLVIVMMVVTCWAFESASDHEGDQRGAVRCRVQWTQTTPLMDRSLSRVPSPFAQDLGGTPTVKATWSMDVGGMAGGSTCSELETGIDTSTSWRLMNEDSLFTNCSVAFLDGDDENALAAKNDFLWQWGELQSLLLPKGSMQLSGRKLSLYWRVLPLGRVLVLPQSLLLMCPVRFSSMNEAHSVDSVLPIAIRKTLAEVSLVGPGLVLSNTLLHMKPRGAPQIPIPADVDELQLNEGGLTLRVGISSDHLTLALSPECTKILGPSATRVGWEHNVGESVPNSEFMDRDADGCLLERATALAAVKQRIVRSISCKPLPCLHANPLFSVSRLSVGVVPKSQALPMDPDNFGGAVVHEASMFLVNHTQLGVVESTIESEMVRLVQSWAEHVSQLTPVLRPSDIRALGDNYVEMHVPPEVLAHRGFLLPSVRHVCWWLKQHTSNADVLPNLAAGCKDPERRSIIVQSWRRALAAGELGAVSQALPHDDKRTKDENGLVSEVSRFHVDLDPALMRSTGGAIRSSDAPPFSKGARWIVQSLDVSALPPRGLDQTDISVPYPSLRYQVSHPLSGHGNRWMRLDGKSLVPLTLSCLLGSNTSASCPLSFGVIAEHLHHGWEATLGSAVREQMMFLACPPPSRVTTNNSHQNREDPPPHTDDSSCGAAYYGSHEAALAEWVRTKWISTIDRSDINKKVLLVHFAPMPPEVPLVQFGQPVYVVIRLPAELALDDFRYPLPRVEQADDSSAGVFGFILLPNDPSDDSGSGHHDEL